jgi:LmbE family N-acetylglucosaminyl deacetylase
VNSLRRSVRAFAVALIVNMVIACLPAAGLGQASKRAPEDRGAMGLGLALKRLDVIASVLHTGAHPDDEDSGLLAYLARGRQARTAYLSLTRGDGGQNLIGPELYEALGVIRTEEMLSARRLDGASQFFTRAFDFGFSKTREEALSKWDREAVLADIVRVIRTFRPMVIVSAWTGTPNDGHGHHQAAGFLTLEAYRAAADPARFPDQIASGLKPWKTLKLYTRAPDRRLRREGAMLAETGIALNTGQYDSLLGRSYYEIAMEGRSLHRSQDQGALQRRGPQFSRLKMVEGVVPLATGQKDLFDAIETTLTGIAFFAGKASDQLRPALEEAQRAAKEAEASYNPLSPSSVSPSILKGLRKIKEIRSRLSSLGLGDAELYETDFLLKQKEDDFTDALLKAEGVVIDCLADDEIAVAGQTLNVNVAAYTSESVKPVAFALSVPASWSSVEQKKTQSTSGGRLAAQADFKVTVARDAGVTQAYWLKNPRKGDMFVPGEGGTGIEPLAPQSVVAAVTLDLYGEKVIVRQPAEYRFADRAFGEIRRDLKVVPAVTVNLSPQQVIIPVSSKPTAREVTVLLTNNSKGVQKGELVLESSIQAAVSPPKASFDLKREGESASFSFTLRLPMQLAEQQFRLSAKAIAGGVEYRAGLQLIAYQHIESRLLYRDAATRGGVIDVKVAPDLKVGYVEGAGDDFDEALSRLGVDVKPLDSRDLAAGDLSRFDCIVTGVRAYDVRADLVANNERMLDYVRRGGTLIVQYNRNQFGNGDFTPYPVKMNQTANSRPPRGETERPPRLAYLDESTVLDLLGDRSARALKVGYIQGTDDKFAETLKSRSVEVKTIEASELQAIALNQFDLIITGPRAYESRPELKTYNERLLDYSREGLLVVLYDGEQFRTGNFPPYPRTEPTPYRVTDERAKVTLLEARHPRFLHPNKITDKDFEGWVQERGTYFLSDWDPKFTPLMASNDTGEPPRQGGEVIARYGRGLYIYTGYAWFRQLPEGVPGAYRLIANLVSLARSKTPPPETSK